MRVLHLESGRHLYGGAKQVEHIVRGLAARGVENILVAPGESPLIERLRDVAVTEACRMQGDLDPGLVHRLLKLVRRHRPDVVHVHSRRGADLWGGLAARKAGLPAVLSRRVDNRESFSFKYRLYAHIIAISRAIETVLQAQGVPAEKISCVRSAINPEEFSTSAPAAEFAAEFGLPEGVPTLAVVAQLIPRKGHRFLLRALPAVLRQFPELRLLLFGQGPLQDDLQSQVDEAGFGDHVVFAGFRDDLSRWLGCVDVLVHPVEAEGLGVSLMQASAAGVPMVASNAGGVPEVVRDGENGIIYGAADDPVLAQRLIELLSDSALRARYADNGRRLARDEFALDRMVAGNLAVYQSLLMTGYNESL